MSNVAIDLTKTVKEIITTMKTAIDNLNSDVATNKTAIDNLKTQILEAVYPVGSVYVSLANSSNPADILGFGTWEALPAGYGLVAQGTATAEDGSTLTFTAGQKSGEFKHQITVGESASHSHTIHFYNDDWNSSDGKGGAYNLPGIVHDAAVKSDTTTNRWTDIIESTGGDQPHNNVSPCLASYIWKRKA